MYVFRCEHCPKAGVLDVPRAHTYIPTHTALPQQISQGTRTHPGVLTTPCGVWMRPTRAREPGLVDWWRSSKRKKSLRS